MSPRPRVQCRDLPPFRDRVEQALGIGPATADLAGPYEIPGGGWRCFGGSGFSVVMPVGRVRAALRAAWLFITRQSVFEGVAMPRSWVRGVKRS